MQLENHVVYYRIQKFIQVVKELQWYMGCMVIVSIKAALYGRTQCLYRFNLNNCLSLSL